MDISMDTTPTGVPESLPHPHPHPHSGPHSQAQPPSPADPRKRPALETDSIDGNLENVPTNISDTTKNDNDKTTTIKEELKPTTSSTSLSTPKPRPDTVDENNSSDDDDDDDLSPPPESVPDDDDALVGGTGTPTVRVEIPVSSSALSAIAAPNTRTSADDERGQRSNEPAAKRRKLSPASREAKEREKLIRLQEKEVREKMRAEEKARREEERRAKEEEKRKREAEREEERRIKEEEKKRKDAEREEERKRREEKKRVKDEEKAAREEEKRKKEEEKSKKERAQTKLNSFFAKPKLPDHSPKKSAGLQSESSPGGPTLSDYQREFPDFFLQSHTKLAPTHRFQRDPEGLRHMRAKVDAYLKNGSARPPKFNPSELFRMMPYRRRRGKQAVSVKEILLKIQNMGGSLNADGASETSVQLQDSLRKIPMKSLKFGEDVRPPYQGTYSKSLSEASTSKLSRNPFYRGLPETNYDYDSEAEWEDPGEGEELDSEEEEDVSEEGDDDMDGFLDDEDDHPVDGKRRPIVGDLEPICTGIRWQQDGIDPDLQMYQMATISDSVTFPINPFSTAYWQKPKAGDSGAGKTIQSGGTGRSKPSAADLSQPGGFLQADRGTTAPGKGKRPFPPEHLAEFKSVVEGSDLSKMGVVEVLKKRFPKVSKDVLKGTLDSVAERVGQKEADKKWVCR